jgi:hypothetical protein
MHEEWTDKLSEYLDGELPAGEQAAVAAHLRGCAACAEVLNDLKRIIARAQTLDARPPRADLWGGVARRIERVAQPRRFSFTLAQIAAAAAVVMAVSGTVVWQVAQRSAQVAIDRSADASRSADSPTVADRSPERDALAERPERGAIVPVSLADAQYDAAVADLEKAVKNGRGRLDKSTIEIVAHNLQIIDQAIAQARDALATDPANAYLNGHLVEARRRKLDLLRRAAALAEAN